MANAVLSPLPATRAPAVRISPQQLREMVAYEGERRSIIRDFVRAQLVEGRDYGTIPIRGRDGAVAQSKPVLFKSGMEKIFSLFGVVSRLERDNETVEMVDKPGVIAYKCILTRGGQLVGEGRGACDVAEKGRVNDAIKIAEKRARMDACLSLGFSEYFTQDLEDYDMAPEARPASESPTGGWQNGEARDMVVDVRSVEMKTSQAGTMYAVLHTDAGDIKAWKNTYPRIEEGRRYKVTVEASVWNGTLSLAVSRLAGEVAAGDS